MNATAANAITDQDKAIAEEKKAIIEQKKDFGQDVRRVLTTTDFSAFPPEVNNTRLYTGAGSAALLQAALAWNNLADELNAAAQGVDWVSQRLGSAPWAGPASAAVTAATSPVAGWLTSAAGKAESAAVQASAVAAAFDAAFAANVSPPAIAANRAVLLQLTAVNFLSGNVPAILATDLMYEEMWAQDVGAMLGYYAP
ncbi:PPE family protein [Mycobacterium sp. RTGN5]|uniref:PPE family protein n=1 Tax=Mycobacterium sp. RTGN5 TaxID=3016522 RepID=UPI0029C9AACD|nr:PPE family protein [Mycobacterium sp. RTGN5]